MLLILLSIYAVSLHLIFSCKSKFLKHGAWGLKRFVNLSLYNFRLIYCRKASMFWNTSWHSGFDQTYRQTKEGKDGGPNTYLLKEPRPHDYEGLSHWKYTIFGMLSSTMHEEREITRTCSRQNPKIYTCNKKNDYN